MVTKRDLLQIDLFIILLQRCVMNLNIAAVSNRAYEEAASLFMYSCFGWDQNERGDAEYLPIEQWDHGTLGTLK